ncbi:MAG: hypothetical protein KDD42_08575, partial [Bdellovibrionales bacterium]|nr:hypothetical protein [Bdellovibrionales bacterium]
MIRSTREEGVYTVLAGILIGAVFFFLISLGIDASMLKAASDLLRVKGDEICRSAAESAALQREAAVRFRDAVIAAQNQQTLRPVTLRAATLFIPTMPATGCFGFYGSDCESSPDNQPFVDAGYPGKNLSELLDQGCGDVTCNFVGSILPEDEIETNPFPQSMWNHLENVGNTVACEFKGSVPTILHNRRVLTFRTVWKRSIRGDFPTHLPSQPFDASSAAPIFPGLAVAVAPEMQTRSSDLRFRFDNYASSFRSNHDPLQTTRDTFYSAPEGQDPFLETDNPPLPTPGPGNYQIQSSHRLSKKCAHLGGGGDSSCPPPAVGRNDTATPPIYSDYEEFMVACANPPAMLRNMFLATVTELLSRQGNSRVMTEAL